MILSNSVIVAVGMVLLMAILKANIVIALTAGALTCGIIDGLSLKHTLDIFSSGLGGGAEIALSYAILGAFAAAVAHSGVPIWMSKKIIDFITKNAKSKNHYIFFKITIIFLVGMVSIFSKNVLPVHIAFIPVLIPPLLKVFSELEIDRRLVSNVMVFGLVFAYIIIPYGFGGIFLDGIFRANLLQNGLSVSLKEILIGMIFPAIGMILGLITSVINYKSRRSYDTEKVESVKVKSEHCTRWDIFVSGVAIICTLSVQLIFQNTIISAMAGFAVFTIGGVVHWKEADDVVTQGFKMMSLISFIMIAAAGFGAVLRSTGDIHELIRWLSEAVQGSKILAAFGMLIVGLLITMGIGSSFSTVPIIAGVYVPLCQAIGFSPLATICIIGASAVAGDAGSPVSDTMLGISSGLNADGQHDHIFDACIPAFIHFNIPIVIFGLLGAIYL